MSSSITHTVVELCKNNHSYLSRDSSFEIPLIENKDFRVPTEVQMIIFANFNNKSIGKSANEFKLIMRILQISGILAN